MTVLTATVRVEGQEFRPTRSVTINPRPSTGDRFVVYGSSRFSDPALNETLAQKHRRYAAPPSAGGVGPNLDGPPLYRKFWSGNPKTWAADADLKHIAANEKTLTRLIVSCKDWTDSDVRAHIESIPAHVHETFVWFHEPNDNFVGASARAGFRDRYVQLRNLVNAINHPRVGLGMILVGWHVDEWRDFWIPGLDAFGFDRYNPTRSGVYKSMAELFDPLWDAYKQTDAPRFLIGETGCDVLTTQAATAAWAQQVINYFDAHAADANGTDREAIWVSWWDAIGHGTTPIINDTQLRNQPQTAAVWRAACVASRTALTA